MAEERVRRVSGFEGLQAAIEADELADAHEAAKDGSAKMSVREYAKFKKMQPQLLYYYLRQGYIKEEPCICGRKVIDVASADAYLAGKAAKERTR